MKNYFFFALILVSSILATWTLSQNYFQYRLLKGTLEATPTPNPENLSENIQLTSSGVLPVLGCESNKRSWKDAVQMVRNHKNNCFPTSTEMRGRTDAIYVEFEATTIACFLEDIKNNSVSKNLAKCNTHF